MNRKKIVALIFVIILTMPVVILASGMRGQPELTFPLPLEAYQDGHLTALTDILMHRIKHEPMNLVVTILFLGAIIHTFCAGIFHRLAEKLEHAHRQKHEMSQQPEVVYQGDVVDNVSFGAEVFFYWEKWKLFSGSG